MARRLTSTSKASGQLPAPARVSLRQALDAVLARWVADGAHTEQTLARMSETVTRFADRLAATGIAAFTDVGPSDVRGFVGAVTLGGTPPELATQHARRTAIRMLFRTLRALGLHDGDPSLDVALPPRGVLAARPLTDDEVTLCRASAQMASAATAAVRAVAWALGEATAVSSEITSVRIRDLDDPEAPSTVHLPGTRRHEPRTALVNPWAARVLRDRAQALLIAGPSRDTLLAYGGAAPAGGAKAQASVCNALRAVLDAAGLAGEADVRPASLRHWAGRSAYDAGQPIEAVARLLGHRSLDATAEDIALRWHIRLEGGRAR